MNKHYIVPQTEVANFESQTLICAGSPTPGPSPAPTSIPVLNGPLSTETVW